MYYCTHDDLRAKVILGRHLLIDIKSLVFLMIFPPNDLKVQYFPNRR